MRKGLTIAFLVFVGIVGLVVVGTTYKVPYKVEKEYQVEEPYQTTETYTEDVPVEYRVLEAEYYNYFSYLTPSCDVWVTIQNVDTKSGYFQVEFDITTEAGGHMTHTSSEYIAIGEKKKVMVTIGTNVRNFDYSVSPPTKEVKKVRDVTKRRMVTKTKKVTKYRPLFEDWGLM